jgi:O-antigen/teichoic acid export membrane protein
MTALRQGIRRLLARKAVRDTLFLQIGKLISTGLGALTALVLYRTLGPAVFGVYGLAEAVVATFAALDLTGIGVSTTTRLAVAVGADDREEILNLLGAHVKVALLTAAGILALVVLLGGIAASVQGDAAAQIAALAVWLAFAKIADALYLVPYGALQSRRSMGVFASLQTLNQAALAVCLIGAALISPTAESLVIGRLTYSIVTVALAWGLYARFRTGGAAPAYPPVGAILRRAWTFSLADYRRRYLGFGVLIALDKNLSNLFIQIPMQVAGAVGGTAAAGFLDLAISAINYAGVITSALFDNLTAIIPQAVGRRDFARLWHDFTRIVIGLAAGGAVVFGAAAVAAPLVIPLLVGESWLPAIPALTALAVYGVVTTAGGVFGPLYRALNLVGRAIVAKVIAVVSVGVIAALALSLNDDPSDAAAIGAWLINGFYVVSVGLTAWFTLRALRKAAQSEREQPD